VPRERTFVFSYFLQFQRSPRRKILICLRDAESLGRPAHYSLTNMPRQCLDIAPKRVEQSQQNVM